MTLEQKVLGFIVGWAWFDALHTALDHRITVPWGFALVTTLICSLLAVRESYLGEGIQAAGSEYAKERILLTNAVGLMQGWAWSEAVDRWVAHYRPRSGAVTEQILVELAVVVTLSCLLVGLRVCISITHKRLIRKRMRRGFRRAFRLRSLLSRDALQVV